MTDMSTLNQYSILEIEMQRDFKGIWIPKEVWLDERLSPLDKVILMEIDSLDQTDRGCFAGNKRIAEFCQCSERKVTDSVKKLKAIGYLREESFDGRTRCLKSNLKTDSQNLLSRVAKSATESSKKCEADTQNLLHSNTYIKTTIKPIKKKPLFTERELEEEFNYVWSLYPRKQGKQDAYKSYAKARNKGVPQAEILDGLNAYLNYIKAERVGEKYIAMGSTWFNQNRWNDDYTVHREPTTRDLADQFDYSDW